MFLLHFEMIHADKYNVAGGGEGWGQVAVAAGGQRR